MSIANIKNLVIVWLLIGVVSPLWGQEDAVPEPAAPGPEAIKAPSVKEEVEPVPEPSAIDLQIEVVLDERTLVGQVVVRGQVVMESHGEWRRLGPAARWSVVGRRHIECEAAEGFLNLVG